MIEILHLVLHVINVVRSMLFIDRDSSRIHFVPSVCEDSRSSRIDSDSIEFFDVVDGETGADKSPNESEDLASFGNRRPRSPEPKRASMVTRGTQLYAPISYDFSKLTDLSTRMLRIVQQLVEQELFDRHAAQMPILQYKNRHADVPPIFPTIFINCGSGPEEGIPVPLDDSVHFSRTRRVRIFRRIVTSPPDSEEQTAAKRSFSDSDESDFPVFKKLRLKWVENIAPHVAPFNPQPTRQHGAVMTEEVEHQAVVLESGLREPSALEADRSLAVEHQAGAIVQGIIPAPGQRLGGKQGPVPSVSALITRANVRAKSARITLVRTVSLQRKLKRAALNEGEVGARQRLFVFPRLAIPISRTPLATAPSLQSTGPNPTREVEQVQDVDSDDEGSVSAEEYASLVASILGSAQQTPTPAPRPAQSSTPEPQTLRSVSKGGKQRRLDC
jgi:hypothetical protein